MMDDCCDLREKRIRYAKNIIPLEPTRGSQYCTLIVGPTQQYNNSVILILLISEFCYHHIIIGTKVV